MESKNKFTMCRLCLCENEPFMNIFKLNDWQDYIAARVISVLLQFQVSETDGFPHVVCFTCLTKLNDFKLFKEFCLKSKKTYERMFISNDRPVKHKSKMDEVRESRTSEYTTATVGPTSSKAEVITSDIIASEITIKEELPENEVIESRTSENSAVHPTSSNAEVFSSDLFTSEITIKCEPWEVEEFECEESESFSKAVVYTPKNAEGSSDDFVSGINEETLQVETPKCTSNSPEAKRRFRRRANKTEGECEARQRRSNEGQSDLHSLSEQPGQCSEWHPRNEKEEKRQIRLRNQRQAKARRLREETEEHRRERLEKVRRYNEQRLRNEPEEQRQARLLKNRQGMRNRRKMRKVEELADAR